MRIVGIIGPYFSGGNRRLIDHNIANVQYVMIAIADYFAESKLVGFFAPHSHTARFEQLAEASEEYYHELDDAIYDRACDAFIVLPGWQTSHGACRDHDRAIRQHKPLFFLASYHDEDVKTLLELLKHWAQACD
jgi:hypothetical protein